MTLINELVYIKEVMLILWMYYGIEQENYTEELLYVLCADVLSAHHTISNNSSVYKIFNFLIYFFVQP